MNKVVGQSMSPDIPPNSYLIFHHLIYRCLLKVGSIIKIKHPTYGLIVKKIVRIDKQNCYWLEGLNINSVSSLEIGAVDLNMVTGIALYTIKAK